MTSDAAMGAGTHRLLVDTDACSVSASVQPRMFRDTVSQHTALQSGPARLSPTTNFTTSCLRR